MRKMLSYAEAVSTLLTFTDFIDVSYELLPLKDCTGKTLAEDVFTDIDFPSFDNSAVDGFAVKFEDDNKVWKIAGEITAGNFVKAVFSNVDAVKIMTGAKLPDFADSVIPVEDADYSGGEITLIEKAKFFRGMNVRKKGEYLRNGDLAIKSGTILGPNHLTLAASCGYSELMVFRQLKLAVLTTGDELIPYAEKPVNDQVRSTNSLSLSILADSAGLISDEFGISTDNIESLRNSFFNLLESGSDIIVTSGGVSVGDHDFVQEVLRSAGAEIIFWKVNIKPGKPFLFSIITHKDRKIPVFSFPGNPVSVYVNFIIFLMPFINKLYNQQSGTFYATLNETLKKKDNKLHFVLGKYYSDNSLKGFSVISAGNQSSGNLATLGTANCLIMFDEELSELQKGARVKCIKI